MNKCLVCEDSRIIKRDMYKCAMYKCIYCGFIHFYGVTEEDVNNLYTKQYFDSPGIEGYKSYLKNEKIHRLNARSILKLIKKFKIRRKLLDIGSAYGFFMDEARKETFVTEGIELSKDAYSYSKECLKLNVKNENIGNVELTENTYDVVTLIGTIEHLIDPGIVLDKIYKSLQYDGVLLITTLNIEGIIPIYHFKPPEHICYFSGYALAKLLYKKGFTVREVKTYYSWYRLSDIIYRIYGFIKIKPIFKLHKLIEDSVFDIKIKLPNNEMAVIATKEYSADYYRGNYPSISYFLPYIALIIAFLFLYLCFVVMPK